MPTKSNLLHFPKRPEPPPSASFDYRQLLLDVIEEHHPSDAVEHALVEQMAQQRELMDRWIVLQQHAFAADHASKDLPMMMRQHAAAERSFHRAIAALASYRKKRAKEL